jgi:hypothetical protein
MNFGDMSIRNLPNENQLAAAGTAPAVGVQTNLPNHRPIYIDDECSTYQETRNEAAWRAATTIYDSSGVAISPYTTAGTGNGAISERFPFGYTDATTGYAFAGPGNPATGAGTAAADPQFTGYRVNMGLSYSKFAYDGSGSVQLNAQLSQWESTCRWCCHARPDQICNIEMSYVNSSPFSTKCGDSVGSKRDAVTGPTATATTYGIHPLNATSDNILNKLSQAITVDQNLTPAGAAGTLLYYELIGAIAPQTGTSITTQINAATILFSGEDRCSLSNAVWNMASETERSFLPIDLGGRFRFFQPFNIAQTNAVFWDGTSAYVAGQRFWMQMFQRTPQFDMSYFGRVLATTDDFKPRFPSTGEGRNSAGADKYAGRGNRSRYNYINNAFPANNNQYFQHFFEHQTDLISQENRDFFDARAHDAGHDTLPGHASSASLVAREVAWPTGSGK